MNQKATSMPTVSLRMRSRSSRAAVLPCRVAQALAVRRGRNQPGQNEEQKNAASGVAHALTLAQRGDKKEHTPGLSQASAAVTPRLYARKRPASEECPGAEGRRGQAQAPGALRSFRLQAEVARRRKCQGCRSAEVPTCQKCGRCPGAAVPTWQPAPGVLRVAPRAVRLAGGTLHECPLARRHLLHPGTLALWHPGTYCTVHVARST